MKRSKTTGRIERENLMWHRFDRLTVVAFVGKNSHHGYSWKCRCDCGNEVIRRVDSLKRGRNQSCGCLQRELTSKRRKSEIKHGLTDTPCGRSWMSVMDRCFNKQSKGYAPYGGKGITVCEFIRATPANLLTLIGERPPNTSIDRIDNNAGYYCGSCSECLTKGWKFNVRWATRKQQARNTSRNKMVVINGVLTCAAEAAEILGINRNTLYTRINRNDHRGLFHIPGR